MAKITDPDNLIRSTTSGNLGVNGNIWIDTATKKIYLGVYGSLSTDGATLQSIYSYIKEEWKDDNALIKYDFPMISITAESMEMVNGWDWGDTTTKNLIRDGGWALKNGSGISQEEYMNVTTLGSFNNSGVDQAYYLQVAGGTPTDIVLTGVVNQAVKIYGDATHENFDYRTFFRIYLREQAKKYDYYDLIAGQSLTELTYKKYAMPLSNSVDLKVTESDVTVDAYGVTITWYGSPQSRTIGASSYNFNIIINGNNKTAEEIYMAVQSKLRKATDVDAGAGTERGDITEALLDFVGDTLKTKYTTDGGVYIDSFQTADTNRLVFVDNTNEERTFPYVAAGRINFNDNLQTDSDAKYWMFFTNANSNLFGTSNAIIVDDNSGVDITGTISAAAYIDFDYDYDGNVQGGRTAGTDADITLVAIGTTKAQYVKATGTILRSTANNFSMVSSLERNFANP